MNEPWRTMAWLLWWIMLVIQVAGLYGPTTGGAAAIPGMDKVGHALAFGVPAAVAVLLRSGPALAIVVVHAIISEPLQAWLTTGRQMDPLDFLADLVGIALGAYGAFTWRDRRSRQRSDIPGSDIPGGDQR